MRLIRLALLALLALQVPTNGAAKPPEIVVRGGVYRTEIERILRTDNVDTSRLSAREVADAIGSIERGRAPDDFWLAYRAHVVAWTRLADAQDSERGSPSLQGAAKVAQAEQAIEATFDEVERIARRYGARLPTPPWNIVPTV